MATETRAKAAKTVTTGKTAAKTPRVKVVSTESAKGAAAAESNKVKKPAFLERALQRTDVKKRDAKPAIEAALAELAAALIAGEELVLPPLGKLKVVKSKDVGQGAQALTLKLRTMKTEQDA